MAKRMILMLGVTAVLLTALGFFKFKQVQSAVQAATFQPPPESVTSVVVQREVWPATTAVIGTMEAVHGVMVSSDLPGTVARINFESGKAVRQGDVLVELDTREEHAQLQPRQPGPVLFDEAVAMRADAGPSADLTRRGWADCGLVLSATSSGTETAFDDDDDIKFREMQGRRRSGSHHPNACVTLVRKSPRGLFDVPKARAYYRYRSAKRT